MYTDLCNRAGKHSRAYPHWLWSYDHHHEAGKLLVKSTLSTAIWPWGRQASSAIHTAYAHMTTRQASF